MTPMCGVVMNFGNSKIINNILTEPSIHLGVEMITLRLARVLGGLAQIKFH